jgi:hypothetical protein
MGLESSRWLRKGTVAFLLLSFVLLLAAEMKFSWIECRFFAAEAAQVSYKVAAGPSARYGADFGEVNQLLDADGDHGASGCPLEPER